MSWPTDSVPKSFQCNYPNCNAKYRRKEHLNRHFKSHSGEASLACPYCENILTRNDLLRRHIRTCHPEKQVPPPQKSKACSPCHARKDRCEGGIPCNACQRRGIICVSAREEILGEHQMEIDEPISLPAASSIDDDLPDASSWIGREYIDIYFETFHPAWPFLHRGTFDFTKEPCVLVQSVVAIGLWVKGSGEAREASIRLHDKLCSAFYAQMDQWCIGDSSPHPDQDNSWAMTTFQSVLLNVILALFIAKENSSADFSMRYRLPDDKYELLVALVQTCRRWGMFSYPNMLLQHGSQAPLALVYVTVEEIKRFGLALYKTCRLCTPSNSTRDLGLRGANDLLTLSDLCFCMPDSDELWNSPLGRESEVLQRSGSLAVARDHGDPNNWISKASPLLHDGKVGFDWI